MTITPEQLDELERKAKAAMQWTGEPVKLHYDEVIQLVAIARAALAWSERSCDSSGCNGWWHTLSCQGRHSEADRALRDAVRGAP